jgi:hypothetical protein
MDAEVRTLIAGLHASPYQYVLAVTGGGTGAASALLSVPGGSRTILEVVVPYSERALSSFLGRTPTSFCSPETACLLARRALERARWLTPGARVMGVSCTASLRSDRPKRGDHRFHLAIQDPKNLRLYSLTLTKDARSREAEEAIVDGVLLNALAECLGVEQRVAVPLLPGEQVVTQAPRAADLLTDLLEGRLSALWVERDGRMQSAGPPPAVVLSGSFNPLHEGHCHLGEVAAQLLGAPAAFELSVVNADKPALAHEEVRRRLSQFTWRAPVWLTRAPTFAEKAELAPRAVFVVGADTAARIIQPRFYGDSEVRMRDALATFRRHGCRFLVAGRLNTDGTFVGLEHVTLPAEHRDLFTGIPVDRFRVDLSSTQLRASCTGHGGS